MDWSSNYQFEILLALVMNDSRRPWKLLMAGKEFALFKPCKRIWLETLYRVSTDNESESNAHDSLR